MRTPRDIEADRSALKAVHGGFKDPPADEEGVEPAIRAAARLND